MTNFVTMLFFIFLISMNIAFYSLDKRGKLNLIGSGLILMALAPLVNVLMSALFLHYYDWSAGGTGEGAGYGAALLALGTFVNGIILLLIGTVRRLKTFLKTR